MSLCTVLCITVCGTNVQLNYHLPIAEIPKRGLKFNATSYLIYKSIGEGILHSIELDIYFKPENSSGLVMYASQYQNGSGSYVLVQLNDGRFEFSFATSLSNVITVR